MTRRTYELTDELYDYLLGYGAARPDEIQQDLISETASLLPEQAEMQISPEQAAFMGLLSKVVGARYAVEVGTFTGFSALAVARALPEDGKLLCLDVSEEYTKIGQRYWERAGVADRIELRLGSAVESLRALPETASIDFSFIDADKREYIDYWDELVPRTRSGGVILVDNVFAGGRVADTDDTSPSVQAIRAFNHHAMHDDRVELTMLPISDGLTVARKR